MRGKCDRFPVSCSLWRNEQSVSWTNTFQTADGYLFSNRRRPLLLLSWIYKKSIWVKGLNWSAVGIIVEDYLREVWENGYATNDSVNNYYFFVKKLYPKTDLSYEIHSHLYWMLLATVFFFLLSQYTKYWYLI